jgi:hypothetical protein
LGLLSVPKTPIRACFAHDEAYTIARAHRIRVECDGAIALNGTNRPSERHVPVESVRRVVPVQAATRS